MTRYSLLISEAALCEKKPRYMLQTLFSLQELLVAKKSLVTPCERSCSLIEITRHSLIELARYSLQKFRKSLFQKTWKTQEFVFSFKILSKLQQNFLFNVNFFFS